MMIHNMCPKPLFRAKHIIALTLVISVQVTLYVFLSKRGYASYTGRNPLQPAQCQYFSKTQGEKFLNLTYRVHKILEQVGIDHWLMYGSVFGAIRVQGPLPWDYDVDIGLNGSEWIASMNLDQFVSAFESQGLKVNQKLWRMKKLLKITTDDLPLYRVELFVFNNHRGWMKRAGWESWLFWLHLAAAISYPINNKTATTSSIWFLQNAGTQGRDWDSTIPLPRRLVERGQTCRLCLTYSTKL